MEGIELYRQSNSRDTRIFRPENYNSIFDIRDYNTGKFSYYCVIVNNRYAIEVRHPDHVDLFYARN
jgi:hypothetical protein